MATVLETSCLGSELYTRTSSEFVSIDIPEERTVEYISPSNNCVILDNGSLMCWGYNYYGEVEMAPTIPPPEPVTSTLQFTLTLVKVELLLLSMVLVPF